MQNRRYGGKGFVDREQLPEIWRRTCVRFSPSASLGADDALGLIAERMRQAHFSEEQKMWIVLQFLEVFHKEASIASECVRRLSDGRDTSPLTRRGLGNRDKLEKIRKHERTMRLISRDLGSVFYFYMRENAAGFFRRAVTRDSAEEYFCAYYAHYLQGSPWRGPGDAFRPNAVAKAEKYFRGFHRKKL